MNDSRYSVSSSSQIWSALASCTSTVGNSLSDCYKGFAMSFGSGSCPACVSNFFTGNVGASSCITKCSRPSGCGGCDSPLVASLLRSCAIVNST